MKVAQFFAVILCLVGVVYASPAKPTLKIGVIVPMTGDNAALGDETRQAIDLALSEHTDSPLDFEVIYEDSQEQQKLVNAAAIKLTNVDKVDAIVTYWTPAANLVGPICERTQTIHLNTSWDPAAAHKYDWTIVHGQSVESFAKKTVEILKIHNAKRLAIAGMVHLGNQICIDAVKENLKGEEIEIVFDQQVSPTLRDMRTYLLKIDQAKPDAVMELWFHPQDSIFMRQKKELGLQWESIGFFDYTLPEDYPLAEGAIFPTELSTTESFAQHFEALAGYPPRIRAGHTYDMMNLFATAAEAAYEEDSTQIPSHKAILSKLTQPRALTNLAIGSATMHRDGWIESQHTLRQIKNGEAVPYP